MLLLIWSIHPFPEAPPVLHFQFVLDDIVLSILSLVALPFFFPENRQHFGGAN